VKTNQRYKIAPLLNRLARKLKSALIKHICTPRKYRSHQRFPKPITVPEFNPKRLKYMQGFPVFSVPLERLRLWNGCRFTIEEHHFLRYYRDGLAALRRFYEEHQPTNLFEYFFLPVPKEREIRILVNPPWFEEVEIEGQVWGGEKGLGSEHGDQGYGPVSEEKLLLEASRLDGVLQSIRERGFRPEIGGYVKGCFMLRTDGQWVFVVREGFHRSAALAHIGNEMIDVQFHPTLPRFVEESDHLEWPMVKNGTLSSEEALLIFSQFFRHGRQL
jgi:hypothetical protein